LNKLFIFSHLFISDEYFSFWLVVFVDAIRLIVYNIFYIYIYIYLKTSSIVK